MIELFNFPMPPSENQLYRNVFKIGRVKTQIYKRYEQEFHVWSQINREKLRHAKTSLLGVGPLFLALNFRFLHSQLFTKEDKIKRLDVSNRLKCFIDLLAAGLEFDDSRFFEIHCKKTVAPLEGVDIKIDFH